MVVPLPHSRPTPHVVMWGEEGDGCLTCFPDKARLEWLARILSCNSLLSQGCQGLGSSPALLLKPSTDLLQLQPPPALQDPTVQAGHTVEVGLLRRGKWELLAQVKPFR